MPNLNTYYPQDLYDEMSEVALQQYGKEDKKRMDKLVKAAVKQHLKLLKSSHKDAQKVVEKAE